MKKTQISLELLTIPLSPNLEKNTKNLTLNAYISFGYCTTPLKIERHVQMLVFYNLATFHRRNTLELYVDATSYSPLEALSWIYFISILNALFTPKKSDLTALPHQGI